PPPHRRHPRVRRRLLRRPPQRVGSGDAAGATLGLRAHDPPLRGGERSLREALSCPGGGVRASVATPSRASLLNLSLGKRGRQQLACEVPNPAPWESLPRQAASVATRRQV